MEYVGSISYGKDSIIIPEVCREYGYRLDRLVHVEIMAKPTIHSDLPQMVEFKEKADKIIKNRYGIEVEHIHAPKSYEEYFYTVRSSRAKIQNVGKIYGFPMIKGNWCNTRLKMSQLNKFKNPKKYVQYIGIACDEPNRFHNLTGNVISPLVDQDITEATAREIAESLDLLSPIYDLSARGGCWFCHNQSLNQLRLLRQTYPEYWDLMLKWDLDSPVSFKSDGTTVHDLETRFYLEDNQIKFW